MPREPMTDDEIADLAKRIYRGEVFTSYNKGMTQRMLPMTFMPLNFLSEEAKKDMIDGEIDMLYAPMNQAGPMSCNGMPVFFEFGWCSKGDTIKVLEKVDAIRKAVEEATK